MSPAAALNLLLPSDVEAAVIERQTKPFTGQTRFLRRLKGSGTFFGDDVSTKHAKTGRKMSQTPVCERLPADEQNKMAVPDRSAESKVFEFRTILFNRLSNCQNGSFFKRSDRLGT